MIYWHLDEQREQIVNIAREFAQTECRPVAMEVEQTDKLPMNLFARAAELGFLGIVIPEEYGGLGLDWITFALVTEEIAKELPMLGIMIIGHSCLAAGFIDACGPELKKKWLPLIASGETVFATGMAEPVGANVFSEHSAKAVLDGNEWVINASKIFTTGIGYASHVIVGAATCEVDPITMHGYDYFVVPLDSPGFEMGKIEHKLGWHGSATGSFYCKNVRIPKENHMIPAPPTGDGPPLPQFLVVLGQENMLTGVECLAQAENLYLKTWDYVHNRIQMGKNLFDAHQVVRHKLVKMRMEIDTLRALVYSTAHEFDSGRPGMVNGRLCKIKGIEVLEYVSKEAILLHGGIGVVVENGVERAYRDVMVSAIAGGAVDILYEVSADLMNFGMEPVI